MYLSVFSTKKVMFWALNQIQVQSIATLPNTAAPKIPQLAVCKGIAAPLEVEAGELPDEVAVPEPL